MQKGITYKDTTAPDGLTYVSNGKSYRGGIFQDYKTYFGFVEYCTTSTAKERIRICYRDEKYVQQYMKPLNP